MSMQPSPPAIPQAPVLSAQDRASIADGIRQGHAIQQQAQHEVQQVVDQTNRELGQTGAAAGGNASVVKDGGGRIVVTGPNGKTVVIDPRVGLDGDQVQDLVHAALQPTVVESGPSIPREVLPILAMAFTFLLLVVWMISRAIAGRRVTAGTTIAALPAEATARLARIEQAVEAVAIEVERISEAQRYSAQLLTDRLAAPGPAAVPAIARTVDASPVRG